MNLFDFFLQGDALARTVALLLLAMSVASWVVIVWKTWLLRRASADVVRAVAAFWQAPDVPRARQGVEVFDREALVLPLLDALKDEVPGTLAGAGKRAQQLTRGLRGGLHSALARLQHGQVLLATVGATAPFVGLLGTVWGIYHALMGIAGAGAISIEQIAAPVGESLIMTAAGLAVAIPAVLAYNVLGRRVAQIEGELEGFAHDLRALVAEG
jgi:biopolymer transport protein ExbB